MFGKKKGHINYSRIGDFIAPPKKKHTKKKALGIGAVVAVVAAAVAGVFNKESDRP